MRMPILSGLFLALLAALVGCGDSGGSTTTASNIPAAAPPPPPPPGPPVPPAAPAAPAPTEALPPPTEAQPTETVTTTTTTVEPAPAENPPANPVPAEAAPEEAKPVAPKAPTFRERAMAAFRLGKDEEAFDLLATHYLFDPSSAEELSERMHWVPGLRRPALATRVAVAVIYTAPKDFKGTPHAIGSQETEQAFAQAVPSRLPGDLNNFAQNPQEAVAVAPPVEITNPSMKSLAHYTGEVGTKFIAALKTKIDAGTFGETLQEAAGPAPVDPNAQPAPAVDPGVPNKNPSDPGQLVPGVWFLGALESENVALNARKVSADVVVECDVTVRPARTGNFVQNDTRMRIRTLKDNKVLFTSDTINNLKVLDDRRKGMKDTIDKEVGEAVAALEKAFPMTPLPEAVTAEVASKRITDLVAEKPDNPLPVMLEARYYVAKGLLKEEQLMDIAVTLVGPEKIAQMMKAIQGGGLEDIVGKVLSDPNIGKLLEGQDPAKLLEAAKGGEAANLLEKLFPKDNAPKPAPPAAGEKPAEEKPAAAP